MSENASEANDQELEQVSGGNDQRSSLDQLKMQDAFNKTNQAVEMASSMVKKINEVNRSIIRNMQ